MNSLAATTLLPDQITVLLIALSLMLGVARLLAEAARRLRQPVVLGEILAGVILGPTVLGAINPELFEWVFPATGPSATALDGLVLLGATLLLFVVGIEVDLSIVRRQGMAAVSVSAFGIAIPFALGFSLAWFLPKLLAAGERGQASPLAFAVFVGIALSITALPVIAKILMDLNISKSDMGTLVISSAMLNDLVGWVGFAVVLALLPAEALGAAADAVSTASNQASSSTVLTTIGLTMLFLVLMMTVARWLFHRILPYIQAHWSWPGGVLAFVMVVALLCAALTEWLGIHSIFGAFIAGVAIGDTPHLRERTRETIYQFIINVFAPLFFASIGLRINFAEAFNPVTVALVFVVALCGKVGGCFLGARTVRMSRRESLAIGFGMAAQGAVGIILGQLALDARLISQELMVAIVIMALGTSLLSGPVMQRILQLRHRHQLIDFLTQRHILIDPRAADAPQLIGEMARRAGEITQLPSVEIVDAVVRRERAMSTGLPDGLAVPHARLDKLDEPCMILARSRGGIDFNSPDGRSAQLIAMVLTPTDQPETQLEMLSLFANTFRNSINRSKAHAVENPTEMLALLNQIAADQSHAAPDGTHG